MCIFVVDVEGSPGFVSTLVSDTVGHFDGNKIGDSELGRDAKDGIGKTL